MSIEFKKESGLNSLLNQYNINKDKYIIPSIDINCINRDNLIIENDNNSYDFICPICLNILNNPINCLPNNNSHSFCKKCIDKYLEINNKCPICKSIFKYQINDNVFKALNKLKLRCLFYKEGCIKQINYSEYFNHINICEFKNINYECQVEKYNYSNKNFEYCKFIGDAKEIDIHFKKCAFYEYQCIFCKENVIQIKLKEHLENKCKIGIINYSDGGKYIGQKNNKIRDGNGIMYYAYGDKYEGQWKDDKVEGFGIFYYSNGNRYEGECHNNKSDGYGIFYISNGDRYEGEWKNNLTYGYGIYYFSNKNRYEGEWKNGFKEGYGIFYNSDGSKYEGEWRQNMVDGYGVYCYSNLYKYEGQWKNGLKEGYGVLFYSNGDIYKGEWKNNCKEGFGIYYFSGGNKYEGEWKKDLYDGYGIYYSSLGIYKGEWKNGKLNGYGAYYYHFIKWIYEGEWKNNQRDGYGIQHVSKGLKYEGKWTKNKIEEFHYIIFALFYIILILEQLQKISLKTYLLILTLILIIYN